MAYIDANQLNDLQITGGIDEKRLNRHGIIQAVKAGTPAAKQLIPQAALESLRTMSGARAIELPVIKDSTATVTTSPSFTIPSNLNETTFYSVTPINFFSGYRVYPAAFDNNAIDIAAYTKAQNIRVLEAMADLKESTLAVQLEAYKTQLMNHTVQVSQGDGTFVFNGTPDELEISKAAQKDAMFFNLETLMSANKLYGQSRVIVNPAGLALPMAEIAKYGAGNDKDLQSLGFFSMDRMHTSDSISAAASSIFNGWLLRDGEMGLVENYPFDFREGTKVGEKVWGISDVEMPFIQARVNTFINREATDASSIITASPADSNLPMTHYEEIAFLDRAYVIYQYSSDRATRPQGIVKLRGKDS